MSARINLNDVLDEDSGTYTSLIDRTYPGIFTGIMDLDEWTQVCDSIDRVLKQADKYNKKNMNLICFTMLGTFASLIIGGVIGYFVGTLIAKPDEDKVGKGIIGAVFGVPIGAVSYYFLVLFLSKCCCFCTSGNKGLLDVCRHLITAVEDVSKLNQNVSFTVMEDISGRYGGARVLQKTDKIFDLKQVWIQAIVDGSNFASPTQNPQQEQHQQQHTLLDKYNSDLDLVLQKVNCRDDIDEDQKKMLRTKVIEKFCDSV